MRRYYELLGVEPTASAAEIKKAFRREIAKYHPDKVQHLGREFQEIAAVKAAELTQAYKTLSDASLRADYDAGQTPEAAVPASSPAASSASAERPADRRREVSPRPPAEPAPQAPSPGARDRAGASDLVRKAAVMRFRQAVQQEFGQCEPIAASGFDVACAPPKGRFWSKVPPRLLARVVDQVDAAAVADTWALALRVRGDGQRESCVFVMGPSLAPVGELARAIAEERRRPSAASVRVVLVPVNTRSWLAHIPADAPPAVKSIIARLKSA